MENFTEKDFTIVEKYILSNFEEKHAIEVSLTDEAKQVLKEGVNYIQNHLQENKNQDISFHFASVFYLASFYALIKISNENIRSFYSKIAALTTLDNSPLSEFISNYIIRYHANEQFSYLTKRDRQILDENEDSILYNCFKSIDFNYLVNTMYPYLFSYNEIEELEEIRNKNIEDKAIFLDFIFNFINEAENRVVKNYENRDKYEESVIKKIRINNIALNEEFNDENNIFEEIQTHAHNLSMGEYIVNNYWDDYKKWEFFSHRSKSLLYFSNNIKYVFFYNHYLYCNGRMLFYIFSALNEPHAFGKEQIDYILEMAPKLRIASYLNEEYANYKKLYNPDARDFDFGKDEAEEVEEKVLPESEQIDEADLKDENIEKLHLKRLSRFTKEQLIELLKKFRDRKEPFVHKKTKQKNWLFVFGMNGDIPPKGFEKIKWEAKYNNRPAKGALIDFLELLGYDIDQLYNVNSIKILNECFECYNKQNEKVPIDQNDFHYIGKTKEREYSKTHYKIFKEMIESIEKQP